MRTTMFTTSYLWSHPGIGTNSRGLACSVLQSPSRSKITDLRSWRKMQAL